jgi:hypothetical protein
MKQPDNSWLLISLGGWLAFIAWAFLWVCLGNEPWYASWPLFIVYLLARNRFRANDVKFPQPLNYWYHALFVVFFSASCVLIFAGDELSLLTTRGCEAVAIAGAFLHSYCGFKRDHWLVIHEKVEDSAD